MKKSPNSIDLAARIEAAAKLPAGASRVPPAVLVSPAPADKSPVSDQGPALKGSKQKKAKPKAPDTVPITLRPSAELLNKYVLKSAERTREEGRVVSAQQIMIETLERSGP